MKAGKSSALAVVLPSDLAKRHGRLVGRHVGGDAADDLDQLHQRHGVHEVQADEPLRPVGGRGQPGDRDRRGVRSQERALAEVRRERGEDRLLDRLVLGRRLDDQIRLPDLLQPFDGFDPAESRLHRRIVDDASRDLAREVALDDVQAGIDPLAADVVQLDRVAGQGADVADARAHLARADNADGLYLGHSPSHRRRRQAPKTSLLAGGSITPKAKAKRFAASQRTRSQRGEVNSLSCFARYLALIAT